MATAASARRCTRARRNLGRRLKRHRAHYHARRNALMGRCPCITLSGVQEDQFQYAPLRPDRREIRLLTLEISAAAEDSDGTAPLRCVLQHTSLLDNPGTGYNAISYTWGQNRPSQKILLNSRTAFVPASAADALRTVCHAVHGKRDLPVWIDALCINQADNEEKATQVSMMGEIYARASKVLIWLGGENATTRSSFDAMMEMKKALLSNKIADKAAIYDVPTWLKVFFFFDSPYFRRLWPIQEVVLSASAMCWRGRFSVDWQDVLTIAEAAQKFRRLRAVFQYYNGFQSLAQARMISLIKGSKGEAFDRVLLRCTFFEASEPRDKVFATLGLLDRTTLPESAIHLIEADYAKSVKDVYTNATVAALQASHRLLFLGLAQIYDPRVRYRDPKEREGDTLSVPSWVPRYDLGNDLVGKAVTATYRGAHAQLPAKYSVNKWMDNVLRVQGVLVGEVLWTNISVPFWQPDEPALHQGFESFAKCFGNLWNLELGPGVLPDQDLIKRMAMTHAMSAHTPAPSSVDEAQFTADFGATLTLGRQYHHGPINDELLSCVLEAGARHGVYGRFAQKALPQCRDRQFAKISEDRYAMVPLFTKPGDVVCIVFGCEVPVVLRPRGTGCDMWPCNEYWQLVGDAYVHGMMEGEHIDMLRAEGQLEFETGWFSLI